MKTVTIDDIINLDPCSTEERPYSDRRYIRKLFGGESITLLEIAKLEAVPIDDRFWAIFQFLPARTLRLLACDFAEHTLHIFEEKHPKDRRPRDCIAVARRHANGEATEEERDAARHASWSAARAAARDAARDAARAAARAAARDAARDATWAAAWAAARDEERKWQLSRVIEVLHPDHIDPKSWEPLQKKLDELPQSPDEPDDEPDPLF